MREPSRPYDLAIIGAGPAGAYLAAKTAAAGCRVAVFDHKAPWEKPCGGGITHKAWSRFPILASPDLPRYEARCSLQVSPTGRFFVIDEGHPLLMVSRRDLSELMLNDALQKGALHFPLAVERVQTWGSRIRLATAKEEFFADFVIGADGVHSLVRNYFLGPLPKTRTLTSIVQFYERTPDDPTMIEVTPFPGYCWSFPRKDHLCVGAGAMEHGHQLKPAFDAFVSKFFSGRRPIDELRGAPLPTMNDKRAYREPRTGSNWALIGDAAGFCDTLTGEGILYAVWSADLFADAYLANQVKLYEKRWRKAFGLHLRSGAWFSRLLRTHRNVDRLFTAITVCPTLRKPMMSYVWNLPSYQRLGWQLLKALPKAYLEWRRFIKNGGRVDPSFLGPFEHMTEKLTFQWE